MLRNTDLHLSSYFRYIACWLAKLNAAICLVAKAEIWELLLLLRAGIKFTTVAFTKRCAAAPWRSQILYFYLLNKFLLNLSHFRLPSTSKRFICLVHTGDLNTCQLKLLFLLNLLVVIFRRIAKLLTHPFSSWRCVGLIVRTVL